MRRIWLISFCMLWLAMGESRAQSPAEAFEGAVLHKQLFLRGFSADDKVEWRWNGTALIQTSPTLHTVAVFTADSVKVTQSQVELEGKRQTLMRTNETGFALAPPAEHVSVSIDLTRADMATMLPQLKSLIFYPSVAAALADLPAKYRGVLPMRMDKTCCSNDAKRDLKACDCAHPTLADCGTEQAAMGMMGFKVPTVTYKEAPEYSEEAHRAKFSGDVRFGLDVDATGNAVNLWIVQPAGLGLDANAAKTARKTRFRPATCHGEPVVVGVYMTLNFQLSS